VDICSGSSGQGRQAIVGLSMTAIFGSLGGYFSIVRDKASNITWRYAVPCRPVIDCTMNDLEWLLAISCPFLASNAIARLPLR